MKPALALAALAACIPYSGGARPIDPDRLRAEPGWIVAATTPQVRQLGPHDCGAAALAMIAGRWKVALSAQDAVAMLPATTPIGMSLGALRDAARARGLTAFAIAGDRETLVHELRAARPVLVGLLLPYGPDHAQTHYEVVVAVGSAGDGPFVTIDPASGWRVRSWTDLDAEWRPVGRPTLVVIGVAPRAVAARR